MPTIDGNINIIIHGLFFMTLQPNETDPTKPKLLIYAPNIPNHHFVGGVRGRRVQLPGDIDWSDINLIGGTPQWVPGDERTQNKIPTDVKGSIIQFTKTETGVGDFTPDPSQYKGIITLPWPAEWYSLRCDDISATFRYMPTSLVGKKIESNARRMGYRNLGIVTCLRYGYETIGLPPWAGHLNVHFYLQPCTDHLISDVNVDLKAAAQCFTNANYFDLQMIDGPIQKTDPGKYQCGDVPPGVTTEDELSLNEEKALDILMICPDRQCDNTGDNASEDSENAGENSEGKDPAVSPANCPNFYVGP
jgi:hypothetical protein